MKNIIMNAIEKAISEINVDAEIVLHPAGEKADGNRSLENFIKSTNQKYYNSNSDILEGDFVEIVINNDDKKSFIRIEMDYLKHMNNTEEVSEYIKHSVKGYVTDAELCKKIFAKHLRSQQNLWKRRSFNRRSLLL